MPKKTARTSKPGQQRSKEEQWRRRMAQQSQVGARSVVAEPGATGPTTGYEDGAAQAAPAPTRAAPSAAGRRTASTSAVAQRANMATARGARVRLSANTLPLGEEMNYIRNDIRKLVILTAICLVVIIALSFVVPLIK